MTQFLIYSKYKDSGFEWIGDIPVHWKTDRIGNVCKERRKKVSDKDFQPLSVTMNGIVPQLDSVAKTDAGDDRKRVCKDDFVINSRSDRRGSSGMSTFDGSVSLICTVLEPQSIYTKYVHYLLRSLRFQEEYYRYGSGIVSDLWSTKYSSMKNIVIPMPSEKEQKQICEFLDYESNNLAVMKRQHELLSKALNEKKKVAISKGIIVSSVKKQSEIEWLDEIPKHWCEIKAKYLFKEMNRNVRPEDDIVTVFRDGQVCLRSKRRLSGFTMAVLEHGYQGIRKGDLILHSMDAFAGAIGVSEDDGRATPEYVVTTPFDNRYNCHYFAEVIRLMASREYIFVICPSVRERAPRFRYSKFSGVKLPVPPIKEQNAIAKYISKLQNLEKKSARLVNLKEEKFKLLANDLVLGKIDVRNWKNPTDSMISNAQ